MAQLKLIATPWPPMGAMRSMVEVGPLPFWEGIGDIGKGDSDFVCGKCGAVLATKNPNDYPWHEIVFRCPKCNHYNITP